MFVWLIKPVKAIVFLLLKYNQKNVLMDVFKYFNNKRMIYIWIIVYDVWGIPFKV